MPYGRRPYSCVLTWASDAAHQLRRRNDGKKREGEAGHDALADTRRLTGKGPVEHHRGPHGLLAHEITARNSEKGGKRVGRRSRLHSSQQALIVKEVGGTHLRTRASDIGPAIAMPTWS